VVNDIASSLLHASCALINLSVTLTQSHGNMTEKIHESCTTRRSFKQQTIVDMRRQLPSRLLSCLACFFHSATWSSIWSKWKSSFESVSRSMSLPDSSTSQHRSLTSHSGISSYKYIRLMTMAARSDDDHWQQYHTSSFNSQSNTEESQLLYK